MSTTVLSLINSTISIFNIFYTSKHNALNKKNDRIKDLELRINEKILDFTDLCIDYWSDKHVGQKKSVIERKIKSSDKAIRTEIKRLQTLINNAKHNEVRRLYCELYNLSTGGNFGNHADNVDLKLIDEIYKLSDKIISCIIGACA